MLTLPLLKQLVNSIKTASARLGVTAADMHVAVLTEDDRVSEIHMRGVGTQGKITVFIELN